MPDLIAAADALCLLSDAEALPLSILEAMALGRPVVTTDVGGAAEAVAERQTGLVVAPGDTGAAAAALARLAATPTGRASWASAAGAPARALRRRGDGRRLRAPPRRWPPGDRGCPDVLLLSLGTTLGWRVGGRVLPRPAARAGASGWRPGADGRDRALRRAYPVTDLVEATAARRALRAAIERHDRARS